MPSFQISVSPKRRQAARFISGVRREISKVLEAERAKSGMTQSAIARALDVHRSVISRELRGRKDMTLGRVAELAWALGREPSFELREIEAADGANVPLPVMTVVSSASSTASNPPTETNEVPSMTFATSIRAA